MLSPRHECDVARLTNLVGEMSLVCTHLHSDAHQLSAGYHNSAGIKLYIRRLDNLKQHMHQMLASAAATGSYSYHTETILRQDITSVRSLLERFYGLVNNQAVTGVCPQDQALLDHMEQVILHEAFPLLVRIEVELYGQAQGEACPVALSQTLTQVHPHGHVQTNIYSSGYAPYGRAPRGQLSGHTQRVEIHSRSSFRPPVPPAPIPPLAAQILSRQAGAPAVPGNFRGRPAGPTIRLGNLRISF
ncbi:MAG TPA: hypothetical protein DDW52_19045 [Planctomycetaceae bacterium]|nr:hypothetical protein [Planctomycetaceae bacterium]